MRPLRHILVCVLLGAVTTVGVAWGIAASATWASLVPLQGPVETEWPVDVPASWPDDVSVYNGQTRGLSYQGFGHYRRLNENDSLEEWSYRVVSTGLPLRAMSHAAASHTLYETVWDAGVDINSDEADARVNRMGLRPLPLGFAVDTAFYGSLWFMLIVSPGIVRRKIRKSRGLCPSCGYDMRGTDGVCPECGPC